jgi:hypothetical protein
VFIVENVIIGNLPKHFTWTIKEEEGHHTPSKKGENGYPRRSGGGARTFGQL